MEATVLKVTAAVMEATAALLRTAAAVLKVESVVLKAESAVLRAAAVVLRAAAAALEALEALAAVLKMTSVGGPCIGQHCLKQQKSAGSSCAADVRKGAEAKQVPEGLSSMHCPVLLQWSVHKQLRSGEVNHLSQGVVLAHILVNEQLQSFIFVSSMQVSTHTYTQCGAVRHAAYIVPSCGT